MVRATALTRKRSSPAKPPTSSSGLHAIGPSRCNFAMTSTRSTLPILPTTLTFDRYFLYELRRDVPLPFQYVLCLSSTEWQPRYPVNNVTFAPVIAAGPHADRDPFRVPLQPLAQGGNLRINRRMYVAVDALQTIGKTAFLPSHLGRITVSEEAELREKLAAWLGMTAAASREKYSRLPASSDKEAPAEGE